MNLNIAVMKRMILTKLPWIVPAAFSLQLQSQSIDPIYVNSNYVFSSSIDPAIIEFIDQNYPEALDCDGGVGGGVEYLMSSLSNDLSSNSLQKVNLIFSRGIYFGDDSVDCITIQEWVYPSEKAARRAMSDIRRIPDVTIYYKFSRDWKWLHYRKSIYLIYKQSIRIDMAVLDKIKERLDEYLNN